VISLKQRQKPAGILTSAASYKIVESVADRQWDEFVARHPQGNIFQSRHMYDVYQNARDYFPLKLFALNQADGQLSGVLSAVVVNEINGLLSSFSSHSIIQGGPLILPGLRNSPAPLLIAEHDKLTSKKALYSETRNMYDIKRTLEGLKDYVYEDHLNYIIRLDQPEQGLWRQLCRSKKNHINKAKKLNLAIEEMDNRRQLPLFYRLVKETYRHARIPLAHISLFESAFDVLSSRGMIKFFLARYQGQYIAAQVFLLFKSLVYAWYAGASRRYLTFHPNEYITWQVLKWGKNQGYQVFDFGGAGNPAIKYGPRVYKREFGGQEVNFGRHRNIYQPLRMKITDIGFNLYQKLSILNNYFPLDVLQNILSKIKTPF
jgi:serine/alanine adding enzyme